MVMPQNVLPDPQNTFSLLYNNHRAGSVCDNAGGYVPIQEDKKTVSHCSKISCGSLIDIILWYRNIEKS
jgi:hypothetical protein